MKEIIYEELNLIEKLLYNICRKYTYKVYSIGVKSGYNWESKSNKN